MGLQLQETRYDPGYQQCSQPHRTSPIPSVCKIPQAPQYFIKTDTVLQVSLSSINCYQHQVEFDG